MGSFSATVDDWCLQSRERMLAIRRASVQELVKEVLTVDDDGGHLPFKTGFLRSSLRISTEVMPPIDKSAVPSDNETLIPFDISQYNLAIAEADLHQTIYIGFTAAYALRMNYGFSGKDSLGRTYSQGGNNFVGLAAQNWSAIVARNIERAKAAVAANTT